MVLNIHGATESDTRDAALDATSFMELNIHGPLKAIRAMLQSIYTCHTRDDKTKPRELRCTTTALQVIYNKGIPELAAQVDATEQ